MKITMKKNSIYMNGFRWIFAIMALWIPFSETNTVSAQAVRIGDLLTFSDGSRGVVCFVDPTNNQKGWVVDLFDLNNTTYRLYNTNSVPSVPAMTNRGNLSLITALNLSTWVCEGNYNTNALYTMKNSPAANAVNPESGWYIPDANQMLTISSMATVLNKAFIKAGSGNITNLLQRNRNYWTSSRFSTSAFYYLGTNGALATNSPNSSYYIRRVRDFDRGNEPHVYWVDEPKKDSIWVKPEVTTFYDAAVVYLTDTIMVSSSVIVHPTFDKDTLYGDTLYVDHPFDKVLHNYTFHVTGPGLMVGYDTLKTVFGCDSIQTIYLQVNEPFYDTITCLLTTDGYKWQGLYDLPADTNELGLYEFPGKKVVDGITVDTVSLLKLTIELEREYFDSLDLCLYEQILEFQYEKADDITVTVTESGVTITPTSTVSVVTGGQAGDFTLMMKTDDGCDSVVHLHIDWNMVKRDTVFAETMYEGSDFYQTVANHRFHVTENGILTYNDTLTAANGCDSIVYITLRVEEVFRDTVCQSQTNIPYEDPYHVVAAGIFTQEQLDNLVKSSGTLVSERVLLTDIEGRDSLVKFSLTVTPRRVHDTTVVSTNMHGGYTWYDSTYLLTGKYSNYTQMDDGCDLLDEITIIILQIDTSSNVICDGDSTELAISVETPEISPGSVSIPSAILVGDILCTDGTTMPVDSFLISGKSAIGIVFHYDHPSNSGLAVALGDAYNSDVKWSESTYPSSLDKGNYLSAIMDLDGQGNTEALLNNSTTTTYPAAYYCHYYDHTTMSTGETPKGWYLPSAGELRLLYGNRVVVNDVLNTLQATNSRVTSMNYWYWSSTPYNQNNAWIVYNSGNVGFKNKPDDTNTRVRAIIKFQNQNN